MSVAQFRRSRLLQNAGFTHAFFTRDGGVSDGAYASLNFSYGVGDYETNVRTNFERAGRALGVAAEHILFLSQVHGNGVVFVQAAQLQTEVLGLEGDAMIGEAPNLACSVRTADCVPVLIGDVDSGRAAAIHAGWRGCVANVIGMTLEALRRRGSQLSNLRAAVGPHISLAAFEISSDVATQLERCAPAPDAVVWNYGDKPHADLRRIAHAQLEAGGLLPQHIDHVVGCTFREAATFFSYRRDGRQSGRHLSAIVPRPSRGG